MSTQLTTDPIAQAADVLLRVVVTGERQSAAAQPRKGAQAEPFEWRDPSTLPRHDSLDLPSLAADPIGTACRAELRRIGHALHAADPARDLTAIAVDLAEMDMTHADWRAIVLETAWAGIGSNPAADPH